MKGKSRRKGEDRSAQIIDTTIQQLIERGLAETSTRSVAKEAGIGAGLINHYFTWSHLRAKAWLAIFDRVTTALINPGTAADKAMDHFIEQAFSIDSEPLWRLWLGAINLANKDEAMAQVLRQIQKSMIDRLAAILEKGAEQHDEVFLIGFVQRVGIDEGVSVVNTVQLAPVGRSVSKARGRDFARRHHQF